MFFFAKRFPKFFGSIRKAEKRSQKKNSEHAAWGGRPQRMAVVVWGRRPNCWTQKSLGGLLIFYVGHPNQSTNKESQLNKLNLIRTTWYHLIQLDRAHVLKHSINTNPNPQVNQSSNHQPTNQSIQSNPSEAKSKANPIQYNSIQSIKPSQSTKSELFFLPSLTNRNENSSLQSWRVHCPVKAFRAKVRLRDED